MKPPPHDRADENEHAGAFDRWLAEYWNRLIRGLSAGSRPRAPCYNRLQTADDGESVDKQ